MNSPTVAKSLKLSTTVLVNILHSGNQFLKEMFLRKASAYVGSLALFKVHPSLRSGDGG